MVVKEETSDLVSEEESKASPEELEDSWETEDFYPPIKMMGRGDGVDSDDAKSEMADPPPAASPTAPTRGNLIFTLDDILYSKWPDRLQEFLAYLTTRALTVRDNHELMIDFVSRFTGTLWICWIELTDQDQVLFIVNEEVGPSSIAALEVLIYLDLSFSGSDSDTCYMGAENTEGINLVNSVPHIPVSVYISKYAKPTRVIAFPDIGAAQTIMNPEVLPKECWKSHTKHFSTASSEVFSTHLISQPLKIQFLPGCYLITRILGLALSRKDIVVSWDIITKVNYLRDFLPKIAMLTRPLEKMLKKDAPSWGSSQTKAIKELKAQLLSMLPLQISSTGKRILQTDASDRYWGVVLLEELNGKHHICGNRSGRFKQKQLPHS
ncbi:hypothetical protein CRG98_033539 [Punica granatum]|uniref:Reverse transcriptase/retrotransposon-derived protein RNase H-like domain-containing protein n=1 Tax=Punica granatum TaxID=22663 RepID=A0A2I0IQ06_PUNGR|nr:hypothetical protein CRG98_033539 [Punica granatum]